MSGKAGWIGLQGEYKLNCQCCQECIFDAKLWQRLNFTLDRKGQGMIAVSPVGLELTTEQALPSFLASQSVNPAVLTRWKPGQSGNPGGKPRTAHIRKHLLKLTKIAVAGDTTRLDCLLDSVIERGTAEGDVTVATFVRDTVDGKPTANDDRPSIGTINIAWGAMPQWAQRSDAPTIPGVGSSVECDNTVDCSLNSNTPPEVQLKVLESAPRRHAQTNPTRSRLSERVPVPPVPVQTVPASKPMSVTRMVAERALAKLADMDTVGMSPATFKNYLAKVRVAEEALAAL